MLRELREFFWPVLDPLGDEDAHQIANEQLDHLSQIESLSVESDIDVALELAKSIYEEENDRSRSSDNKAFQYLLVAAAIISLLTYLETAVWDGKVGTAPRWLSLPILLAAVAYLVRAALWALKAVSVRTYHVVGVLDLVTIWRRPSPKKKLLKEILRASLQNQDGINLKVSSVTMATAFLSRTIIAFGVLLTVEIVWEFATTALPWLAPHVKLLALAAKTVLERALSP